MQSATLAAAKSSHGPIPAASGQTLRGPRSRAAPAFSPPPPVELQLFPSCSALECKHAGLQQRLDHRLGAAARRCIRLRQLADGHGLGSVRRAAASSEQDVQQFGALREGEQLTSSCITRYNADICLQAAQQFSALPCTTRCVGGGQTGRSAAGRKLSVRPAEEVATPWRMRTGGNCSRDAAHNAANHANVNANHLHRELQHAGSLHSNRFQVLLHTTACAAGSHSSCQLPTGGPATAKAACTACAMARLAGCSWPATPLSIH